MNKPIYNITPFTLLDYPEKTACIFWFAACNMRCKYCYNVDIVKGKGTMDFKDVYPFLDKRKGLLDGVVLSGGECLLHAGLNNFLREIKARNLLIKIDTNGTRPHVLKELIEVELVDYVALDFKSMPNQFYWITQTNLFGVFEKTLDLLLEKQMNFEIRTTVHSDLLSKKDIQEMIYFLERKNYSGTYYIQKYFNDTVTLGELSNDEVLNFPGRFQSENFEIVIRNEKLEDVN